MHRVLSDVARVAPGATRQITGDRGDPLVAKRGRLLELQAQFESLDASYVAMLAAVRATLAEYGVDPTEAGFEPHASLRDLNRHCDATARSFSLLTSSIFPLSSTPSFRTTSSSSSTLFLLLCASSASTDLAFSSTSSVFWVWVLLSRAAWSSATVARS